MSVLRVKKLTELAILPTRGSALAAGFDLSSAYDAVIPARGKGLVKTDLAIAVPDGCYARVGTLVLLGKQQRWRY
jgi:dUTPase